MVAIAEARPNIALIKYWGKQDAKRNIPAVSSLSITLSGLRARTEVVVQPSLAADRLRINGTTDIDAERRVGEVLDRLRAAAGNRMDRLDVSSDVNFPVAAGLASSAAGFAALVCAANEEYACGFDTQTLARLAGSASGSAARSLYPGFVRLHAPGRPDSDIDVEPLANSDYWPLSVVIAITDSRRKPLGSTEAMLRTAETSVYYDRWLSTQETDIDAAVHAVGQRDFQKLADVSEASCLKMHGLMMSAVPGIIYWNSATVAAIGAIRRMQSEGVPVFFTIDAGPQVKAVCLPDAQPQVTGVLGGIDGVSDTLIAGLGDGARIVS